ncbi:MAG: hypothetical protein QG635_802 [Bacteroidota bacterium]|nr:hypothetical protein [Bacteroidota bacterium]
MKIRILFVDDEPNQIQGVRKLLFNARKDWHVAIIDSCRQALLYLQGNPTDVVISDLRMPEMDGTKFLNKVKEKYPGLIRIIISEYSDREKIVRAISSAHQIWQKPYNINYIISKIDRIFKLRGIVRNEKLLNLITGIGSLPSLPSFYEKIDQELQSPNFSLVNIAEIISRDLATTAKTLQLVNSAIFGMTNKITSIHEAVKVLGPTVIQSFLMYVKLFSTIKIPDEYLKFMEILKLHSIKVADFSNEIFSLETPDSDEASDVYTTGLLHDIGQLALLQTVPHYYDRIQSIMHTKKTTMTEAEYQFLGTSHAEIGAYLLGLWDLPHSIVEAIAFHHYPSKARKQEFGMMTAIHLANAFEALLPHIDIVHLKKISLNRTLIDYIAQIKEYNEE